jgi:coatomer protein complex subunit gamma
LLSAPSPSTPSTPAAATSVNTFDQQAVYADKLSTHFSAFGTLFKSSVPIPLTESETEYVVNCIKHTFAKHIVFQFDCTNTLNDQLLENVHIVMQPEIDGLIQVAEIPAEKLEYGVTGVIYVAFEQQDPDELGNGNLEYKYYDKFILIFNL